MNQQLETTLSKIFADQEVADALSKCTSPQEAYDFALTQGSGFTLEEFQAAMAEMSKQLIIQAIQEGKIDELKEYVAASGNPHVQEQLTAALESMDEDYFGELTDEDLMMVAGGRWWTPFLALGMLGVSCLATL